MLFLLAYNSQKQLHNILLDNNKSFFLLLSLKPKKKGERLGSQSLQCYCFLLTYRIQDSVSLTADPVTDNTEQTNYCHCQLNYPQSAFMRHDSTEALRMWQRSSRPLLQESSPAQSSVLGPQLSSKKKELWLMMGHLHQFIATEKIPIFLFPFLSFFSFDASADQVQILTPSKQNV